MARSPINSGSGDSGSLFRRLFFYCLINCAKRFDFELDHRVLNYLLNDYIRVVKSKIAIDFFNSMICEDVIPWVPCMNILLMDLVRRNMIDEVYGDHYIVHVTCRAFLK